MLCCFMAGIIGLFGWFSYIKHNTQHAHPLYPIYHLYCVVLLLASLALGILLIPLLYWHFKVRDVEDLIFEDYEIPFSAKYTSNDQTKPLTQQEVQEMQQREKEYEYKRFRETMGAKGGTRTDNMFGAMRQQEQLETANDKEVSVDVDVLIDYTPIVIYDKVKHATTYACPVCKQLMFEKQTMKVWTNCEHLVHSACYEDWLRD